MGLGLGCSTRISHQRAVVVHDTRADNVSVHVVPIDDNGADRDSIISYCFPLYPYQDQGFNEGHSTLKIRCQILLDTCGWKHSISVFSQGVQ